MTALDPKPYQYILIAAATLATILIALVIFLSIQLWTSNQREKSINKAQKEQLLQTRQEAERTATLAADSIDTIERLIELNKLQTPTRNEPPKLLILRGDTSTILSELQRISAEVNQD